MNEAEKKLFAIFVAELMKNNIITEDDWLEDEGDLGEYAVKDEKGKLEIGTIVYDPSKADPVEVRENVLERKDDKKKK